MSKHITHGYHLVKGKSNHAMEDYLVSEFKQEKDNELGLFAIFDGHLGHDVANYLQTHLFDNILKEVLCFILFQIYFHFSSSSLELLLRPAVFLSIKLLSGGTL